MSADMKLVEELESPRAMHPKKFAMWLFIITVVMIFVSLTSAYIVKRGDGDWRVFELPQMFWVTSGIIVLSSITLFYAQRNARQDNLGSVKLGLWLTLALGVAFGLGQFYSWGELISENVYFTGGNPSESFIYVLTSVHLAHILGGLIFTSIVLVRAYQYKVHSKSMVQMEMLSTFWHFLGLLWIYLFVFLILNHQ